MWNGWTRWNCALPSEPRVTRISKQQIHRHQRLLYRRPLPWRYRFPILQNMQNPELKWEQKMDYNIGLDAVFMGVDIRMDFYKSITKDLVSSVGIAPSTGFTTVSENLGKWKIKDSKYWHRTLPGNHATDLYASTVLSPTTKTQNPEDFRCHAAVQRKPGSPCRHGGPGFARRPISGWLEHEHHLCRSFIGYRPCHRSESTQTRRGAALTSGGTLTGFPCGVSVPLYRGTVGITGGI